MIVPATLRRACGPFGLRSSGPRICAVTGCACLRPSVWQGAFESAHRFLGTGIWYVYVSLYIKWGLEGLYWEIIISDRTETERGLL